MTSEKAEQASCQVFASLADFESSVGKELGRSRWRVVSQPDIDAFATSTDDWQWVHCDPVKAAQGPFSTTIAHGYFTMSLLSNFAREIYKVQGVSHVINYGMDRLRFPAPVPVGSAIRAVATLISLKDSGPHALATVRYEVQIRGGTKPALTADTLVALVPAVDVASAAGEARK